MRRDLIVGGNIADLVPVGIDGRYVYSSAESFRDALIFNRKSERISAVTLPYLRFHSMELI